MGNPGCLPTDADLALNPDLLDDVTPRADAYALDYAVSAKNLGDQTRKAGFDVQLAFAHDASQTSSFLSAGPTAQLFGVCDQTGSHKREEYKSVKDEGRTFDGGARWAALG